MANTFLNTPRIATSNPQANVNQVNEQAAAQVVQPTQTVSPQPQVQQQPINPITIPIQIQPQIGNTGQPYQVVQQNKQLQANNEVQAPTPQAYQQPTNTNTIDFNKIYSAYQSQYGTNVASGNTTGIRQSSIGTTIVTPTASPNTVKGQYQSQYADTINGIISEMLRQEQRGFQYDPTQDSALRAASEYASSSAMEMMAARGILNSSSTAERVAAVVSELIPQYEQIAYSRWNDYLGRLANTAQVVMEYDKLEFEQWKDAKDREWQKKMFDYQKQQDAITNAWKRVDQLGYVDNKASKVLGVKVGTLSKDAREAKEQREFELKKMREQAEIEYKNNVALYKVKAQIDKDNEKEIAQFKSNLNVNETEKNYQLQQKYNVSSTSKKTNSANTTSLKTYENIIKNRWANYDDSSKKYTVDNVDEVYNYLVQEAQAGRLGENDFYSLMSLFNITPSNTTGMSTEGAKHYTTIKAKYDETMKGLTSENNKQRANTATENLINNLYKQGKITKNDLAIMLSNFGFA